MANFYCGKFGPHPSLSRIAASHSGELLRQLPKLGSARERRVGEWNQGDVCRPWQRARRGRAAGASCFAGVLAVVGIRTSVFGRPVVPGASCFIAAAEAGQVSRAAGARARLRPSLRMLFATLESPNDPCERPP